MSAFDGTMLPDAMSFNQARIRRLNETSVDKSAPYVLYWMQSARRLSWNHALDYAITCAKQLGKPLVVYEGLRLDYPWASARFSGFIIEGMRDNAARAAELGICYWPFVETTAQPARGLLRKIVEGASLVVTDDFPCFIIPDQTKAVASFSKAVFAVDNNSVVPISLLGTPPFAAVHLRRRLHQNFENAFKHLSAKDPALGELATAAIEPPFQPVDLSNLDTLIASLPVDQSVARVSSKPGGTRAARAQLHAFLKTGLPIYAEDRSKPAAPSAMHGSGLSPYLHFGHLSIDEVVHSVLGTLPAGPTFNRANLAKREGFFSDDVNVNSFLDEAMTWRDVGYVWHWTRRLDTRSLEAALPSWATNTLKAHAADKRSFTYSLEQWERGETHDELWNAAQKELVATGVIHNYLRMLWGKKVLEWSPDPETAYQTLVHLNNKYALDGRNPNSYTGILWCFGLFDRPWAPERPVFGQVRFMSSDSTAKKFKLKSYLDWVARLPRPFEEACVPK